MSSFTLPCKVEVADPKQKTVRLGALQTGQSCRKTVELINRSLAPVTFRLAITPSNPALQDSDVLRVMVCNEKTQRVSRLQSSEIALDAKGGRAKVDVIFEPKKRISEFSEEVSNSYFLLLFWSELYAAQLFH